MPTFSRRVVRLDTFGIVLRVACVRHILLGRRLFGLFGLFGRRFWFLELRGGLTILLHLTVAI